MGSKKMSKSKRKSKKKNNYYRSMPVGNSQTKSANVKSKSGTSKKSKKQNSSKLKNKKTASAVNKRRFLGEVTVFEIILCLFVILIHLCSEPISELDRESGIGMTFFFVNKIISFAVSGFIFSSGLKLFYSESSKPVGYLKFISRRITKIYIPYILWVCAYYVFFVYYMEYFEFNTVDLLKYIGIGDLVAHFYFILIIMQFYLLFPLCKAYVNYIHPFFGIIIAVFITVISKAALMDVAYTDRNFLTYLIFFILGCYVGKNYEVALQVLNQLKYGIYLLAIGFAFAYTSCSFYEFQGLGYFEYTEVLKIFFCIFMFLSMFIVLANSKSVQKIASNGFVKLFGAATFYIYLMHCMLIFAAEKWLTENGIVSIIERFAIKGIFVCAASILIGISYVGLKKLILKPFKK